MRRRTSGPVLTFCVALVASFATRAVANPPAAAGYACFSVAACAFSEPVPAEWSAAAVFHAADDVLGPAAVASADAIPVLAYASGADDTGRDASLLVAPNPYGAFGAAPNGAQHAQRVQRRPVAMATTLPRF